MKNYLQAKIEHIDERYIYLATNDEGYYFMYLDNEHIYKLDYDQVHKFYIATFTNEFETQEIVFLELKLRNLFLDLIKIKTVGLKTTLFLMNNFAYDEIYHIVQTCDVEKLASLKGIGIYTARLIIDTLQKQWFGNKISEKKDKVVVSLIKLGFHQKDILRAIHRVDDHLSIEEMIESIMGDIND